MKKYLAGITSAIATLACILANYLVRLVNKEVSMSYKAWEGIGKEIIIYIVLGLIIGYNIYVLSKNIKNNTITIIVALITHTNKAVKQIPHLHLLFLISVSSSFL